MHLTIRRSLLLIVLTAFLGGAAAFAQDVEGKQGAAKTRAELSFLLQKYPPRLGEILRLDHSLLSNENYLAPYPDLRQFLQQHPEVLRDPDFYVGNSSSEIEQLRARVDQSYRRTDT